MPGPAEPLKVLVVVHTASGSAYRVAQDARGAWWMLGGENVANPRSQKLPVGWWPIERPCPWPVEIGRSVLLQAHRILGGLDARRAPGGGKCTSVVIAVLAVDVVS